MDRLELTSLRADVFLAFCTEFREFVLRRANQSVHFLGEEIRRANLAD